MKTKIKTISKILIFSFFLILTISCDKSEVENKSFFPQTITQVTINKGGTNVDLPSTQPNFVINNDTQWQLLLNNFSTDIYNSSSNPFSQTNIDFSNFQIIVVTQGGGATSDVTISNIVENIENITITTQRREGLFDVYGYGYHIVKMPKSIKPVIFQ
jgi:hypothetical protein